MKNNIWNNEELKQIKLILKTKMLLTENNNNLELSNPKETTHPFKGSHNAYISILQNEIIKLLESNNKEEIRNIIKRNQNIEFDKNNSLHYGLISTLSKLETSENSSTYCAQIFTIVNEIIVQYDRIISLVTDKHFKNINSPEEIKEEINKIKNNEIRINNEVLLLMHKIFNYTNKLNKEPLLKELINNCNNNINQRIIDRANHILSNAVKVREIKKNSDANFHKIEFNKKYRADILETRKKYNGGIL